MLPLCLIAQQNFYSKTITKTIVLSNDTVVIDTLTIVPSSFKILNNITDTSNLKFDFANAKIILKKLDKTKIDTLVCSYATFPQLLTRPYFHKDYKLIENPSPYFFNEFAYNPNQKKNDFLYTDKLNKNGSIARGINFGNNQDIVVNSQLNLQLNGKLSERINILAAIADDNIPIQPDGNTQQLQDFDKVFIQLFDDKNKLTVGDYTLYKPALSYFSVYNKRSQGAMFSNITKLKKDTNKIVNITAAAAVSRGKFHRYQLPITEGNQGPYQLRGADNELFVIVLSGSERVFMDGVLLKRGLEYDYVIDYNSSQIRFMPKRQITKDRRLFVEFQYSDKNFARSVTQFGASFLSKKTTVYFDVYNEQDNKKKPLLQTLNDRQKQILELAGDSIQEAVDISVDTVEYDASKILYENLDTIIVASKYNIYRYSTKAENAKYRLTFSDVGIGKGSYVQTQSSANGKVYKWIAPINGVAQGQFEPVILLVTPKQKTMFVAGINQAINSNNSVGFETAISHNDINTFSTIDTQNDNGVGIKTFWKNNNVLSIRDTSKWILKSKLNYEFVAQNFTAIERFRQVEFDRDWNSASHIVKGAQHISSANIVLQKTEIGNISYTLNSFVEQNYYSGLRHNITTNISKKKYTILGNASLLNANTNLLKSDFLRHKLLLKKSIKNSVSIGASEEQERNRFITKNTDALTSNTNFFEWQAFANTIDTASKWFKTKYINRKDWNVKNNLFTQVAQAQTIQNEFGFNTKKHQQFKSTISYRQLKIIDTLLTTIRPENTLLTREEATLQFFKNAIVASSFYEFGSGLETKKEYSFVEVAAGQGIYTWNDYNDNGIRELNEFEIAVFKDKAKYLKVFTPTNQFIKIYNNQFNQVLTISPNNLWGNSTNKIKKLASKVYNQTVFRTDKKTGGKFSNNVLNPLNNSNDSALISAATNFRNTIAINRNNAVFAVEYTYVDNTLRNLLINGFEERKLQQHSSKIRCAISNKFSITFDAEKGVKNNISQFFSNRNFRIVYYTLTPTIIFQPTVAFRTSINYTYKNKSNVLVENKAQATFNTIAIDTKYNVSGKSSLKAKFSMSIINSNADVNSPIAFEMLEALQNGKNFIWNLSYQQLLNSNLQLSITYDGRKSETSKMIHNGGVQLRAAF